VRRFDAVLWEGAENRIASVLEPLGELEEHIAPFMPGAGGPSDDDKRKRLDRIADLAAGICKRMPVESISVGR